MKGRRPIAVGGRAVRAVLLAYVIQGRWWARETRRRYVRVRLEGGAVLDLYDEHGQWFVAAEHD